MKPLLSLCALILLIGCQPDKLPRHYLVVVKGDLTTCSFVVETPYGWTALKVFDGVKAEIKKQGGGLTIINIIQLDE